MKPRINVYLDDHVAAQLTLVCKRPGANKSRIVNDALDRLFNPEKDTKSHLALIRRLDRMSNSMERMDRNQSIEVETLALFIRYFLTITPPLSGDEQTGAHALGKERFEVFVAQVGRRLAQDKNLLSEVLETIAETRPDLFTATAGDADTTNAAPAKQAKRTSNQQTHEKLPPLQPVIFDEAEQLDPMDFELEEVDPDDFDFEEGGFEEEGDHAR
ncbi:MAG: hypothetical protein WBC93_21965 [Sulfitobacter sp.]